MDYSELRVIHASKDAPPVNVRVGFKNTIKNLDHGESSGYVSVLSGSKKLAVEAIIPGGNADVIEVKRFNFEKDVRYNILAINETADIEPLIVAESAAEPGTDEVAIAVVHASTVADSIVDSVDVYVTTPGVPLNPADRFTFSYTDVFDAGALSAGPVQIRVTAPGSTTPVYDSGTVDLSPFAGEKILLTAISSVNKAEYDPANATGSPIKLLAATDIAQVELLDQSINAAARVIHLSPDVGTLVGAVEVYATSPALASGATTEIIDTFEYTDRFPGSSDYALLPPGTYDFAVAPDNAGVGSAVPDSINSIALAAGGEYTVIAAGNVEGILTMMPASSTDFDLLATFDEKAELLVFSSETVIAVLLGNLIRNAILYTNEGGINIVIYSQQLAITDSGPGIPQQGIDKLFEPFQRAGNENASGYGIGLTIVKRLCDRFGWEIEVSSEPRKGTCFKLKFGTSPG